MYEEKPSQKFCTAGAIRFPPAPWVKIRVLATESGFDGEGKKWHKIDLVGSVVDGMIRSRYFFASSSRCCGSACLGTAALFWVSF